MLIYKQVYITLKRLNIYKNSIVLNKIANQIEMRFSIINLLTYGVIITIFKTNFRACYIQQFFKREKLQAKNQIKIATTFIF